ncbi:aldo/keto reductase [Pelagibius sp. 7325]|uniref:aldo/keto reductase n=1 Tax=Pelagibius sp. 7325 TaxID=3131994 RepID=UPI0030EEF208
MQNVKLGTHGPLVSRAGLGCMAMSGMYGPADRKESLATIHAALEAGVTLLDTGDFYGMGHNELLIGEALKQRDGDNALVSVKFGALRDPAGGFSGYDGRPAAVKNFLAYSLQRLGRDHIDIYRPSRLDPDVPIEDTIGAIAEMVEAGTVRYIGLSEVGPETIRRAAAVHPIVDLQIEYSLLSRGIEQEILPLCRELGIAVTAYGVLSRGLLSGHWQGPNGEKDFRAFSPRFQDGNLERNLELAAALARLAEEKNATAAQAAIAWVLAQGGDIVPLIGARNRRRLEESLEALDLTLTADDLAAIERAVPKDAAAGARYPAPLMAMLDSEKAASAS